MLQNNDKDILEGYPPGCFGWYMRMIGRRAEKLLDIIGNEDEYEAVDGVVMNQDLLDQLMEDKKIVQYSRPN